MKTNKKFRERPRIVLNPYERVSPANFLRMDMRECSVNSQSYNLLLLIADDLVKMLRITFADWNVVITNLDFLTSNRLHFTQ